VKPQTSERKEDVGLETPTTEQSKTRSGQAMSPEAQRIAIAKACGWKKDWWDDAPIPVQNPMHLKGKFWISPDGKDGIHVSKLPDYLSDLNAMHEAEKVLTEEQCNKFYDFLDNNEPGEIGTEPAALYSFHVTAAQRAEAFLKTLNLWKPDLSPDFQKHQG
jgi:hypothetical protein